MSSTKRMLIIGEPGQPFLDFFESVGYELRNIGSSQAASLSTTWRPHVVVVDPSVVPDLTTFADEVRWSNAVLVVSLGSAIDDRDLSRQVDISLASPIDPPILHAMLTAWPARSKTTKRLRKPYDAP